MMNQFRNPKCPTTTMKHDRIQKAPSSGFTLTELLVVIAR